MELDRFVRPKEFMHLLGCKSTKLYNMIADGTVPKPIKLGGRNIGWRESVVKETLDKIAEAGAQ